MKVKEMSWRETELDWYCPLNYGHYSIPKEADRSTGLFMGKFQHSDIPDHYSWICIGKDIASIKFQCLEHHTYYVNLVADHFQENS